MSVANPYVQVETYRVRPRFIIELPLKAEEVAEQINKHLRGIDAPCIGTIYAQFGTIYLPQKEQHYWSPQLTLSLEQDEEKTIVHGMYGPRSSIWTMFVFLYVVLILATVMVSVIGLSYYMLAKPSKILWLVPLFLAAFSSLYLAARAGQRMGRPQVEVLHEFLERSLGFSKS